MLGRIKALWATMSRPAKHISLGTLTLGGFIAGVVFWGGFNTALEVANTEAFCISCHEMEDTVYVELQQTVHWSNSSGVRATCSDCHVPHNWTDKIARKMQASKEVWGHLFGTINTPEKFEAKRLELATHEWNRLSANGSLECKNCHNYDSMKWDEMSEAARTQMQRAAERDQSCIDCHKGIAHHLPKDMAAASGALAALQQQAVSHFKEGQSYYSIRQLPLFQDEGLTQKAGVLNAASPVTVVAKKGDVLEVEIAGWRKAKGFGRVITEAFGQNIREATLSKEAATDKALIQQSETKEDPLTGLPWQQVSFKLWMKSDDLVDNPQVLWQEAQQIYVKNCSTCHAQPAENHFDANTWPGMFAGMLNFVNLDGDTQELVLKYLQMHSSNYSDPHH
ncbi:trimethylamine-N-oxide reductase c-type cytochrome TorC [Ferrimonas balearica DSM 9799]|uniref:Cytochrome c-type protein n=1 Tax=Ferrimonas balearica (strain DSM 9799 / CCM 4581 / KCTC 23876 / PAT) TaxID=550540 RepID=E1SVR7_FERBD|nr:pentaheme c-type cytochrome TorC [Ferrimonas balearica]ADN76398.1 trimethylamine-N-oxide reductase c-type cytochrome TorC [Ferrimonas balearica DSM 9799]MBY6093147.1 pentaheme c-type cytochrome TorC [Ferrimonas balearica]